MKVELPKHGIWKCVPERVYRAWPCLSQSIIKKGRSSMAHLRDAELKGESVPTDSMQLGSALHTAMLEPELLPSRVVRWDGGARRGKEWEAFKYAHADKIILTENSHDELIGMVRSLRQNKHVKQWQSKVEDVEVSAVGEFNGLTVKARCDALTPDPLIDLKMVRTNEPRAFANAVMQYGYHIQGALYRHIFGRSNFWLVTVERTPPHDVVVFDMSRELLDNGLKELTRLTDSYKHCAKTGVWPGRCDDIYPLELPEWAKSDLEIYFGDEEES